MKDHAIKKTMKKARSFCMFWIAQPTSKHLEAIRL